MVPAVTAKASEMKLAIGFLSTRHRDALGVTQMAETLVSQLLADGNPTMTAAMDGAMHFQPSETSQGETSQGAPDLEMTWEGKTFRKTCPAGCTWPADFACCEIYGCSGPYTDCIEVTLNIPL